MGRVSYRTSFWGGGISGGKHVRWEYLTASMQNFKFGVDSRGETQVRGGGGESPLPRVLYETLMGV